MLADHLVEIQGIIVFVVELEQMAEMKGFFLWICGVEGRVLVSQSSTISASTFDSLYR